MNFFMKIIIIFSFLSVCSTYVENKKADDFVPIHQEISFEKSDSKRYVGALISLSTNSWGSYFDLGRNYTHLYDTGSSSTYNNSSVYTHVDVQNASTYRIRFQVVPVGDITLYGANDDTRTMVTFNRIANT